MSEIRRKEKIKMMAEDTEMEIVSRKKGTKEYLEQAFWLDRQIESKITQIEALKSLTTRSSGMIQKDPVQHSRKNDEMERTIAKIVDMEAEINREIDRLVDLKQEIRETIRTAGRTEYQTILEMRYLCFLQWDTIAEKMNISRRHVMRLHMEALEAVRVAEVNLYSVL